MTILHSQHCAMVLHVLGLGESILDYLALELDNPNEIGVNDIWKFTPCKNVVCIDSPLSFKGHRLEQLKKTKAVNFYTHVTEWEHQQGYYEIKLQHAPVTRKALDTDVFCASNNSPFVACQIAYKLGATEIVLWGADFNTHVSLSGEAMYEKAKRGYQNLAIVLEGLGVKLYVGSDKSRLKEILPIWE